MRNDTRTAGKAAAARWFTRSVDGVTAARAGKQLVIKDGTPCKDVSVPLDRAVGGEGEVLESGIHLGGASVSVGENDVSVTGGPWHSGGGGRRAVGSRGKPSILHAGRPSINFRKPTAASTFSPGPTTRRIRGVPGRQTSDISRKKKIVYTDVDTSMYTAV